MHNTWLFISTMIVFETANLDFSVLCSVYGRMKVSTVEVRGAKLAALQILLNHHI